jgi:protein-disulfide isomerase
MARLVIPVGERDHIQGSTSAPVTLVEYGDLQCPYCREAHFVLQELLEETGDSVRFVFRHFPLLSLHPQAERAALAAEAAGDQGQFWQMHDALYESQDCLEDACLREYAEALNLEMGAFEDALRIGRHLPRIKEDFLSGVRSGVNGTPTFFINGVRHDGSYQASELRRALKQAVRV